ncbi:glycosyltransferase EpsE [Faecalimonas umbilicata]|uniref:Glycosyltransferase EpsE n=1 Tax=Faecalimonas umbilicata TaxID=1912855 RepID=A0A4R3JRN6_9FIRM|nr:glycosyltransferase family 2 protein [Faecalimonas umbilicata]TCS69649.1 glycosyltransferase EpsE [Faecalimonas umbilicata]GBU05936.1 putative glycosyltransferase EpsE [Faecalimonas umbilicata]
MNNPIISVIMGTYNCADTVKNAIDSVVAQTFEDWEFIICDDCSTDNTYHVLKEIAEGDKRIKIVRNESNKKLAYTLNHCLEIAKGKYIARMDADDICFPDRLSKQVKFLDQHKEYAVVGGGIIPYDDSGEHKARIGKEIPEVRDMIKDVPFYHPTIMMRKSVYKKLNGYTVSERTIRGQDLDLWFRFFSKGFKGYNLQEPVLKYHQSMSDYKKIGMKVSINIAKTRLIGFKINRFPIWLYPFAIKPIITELIPKRIMYIYHHR